MSSEQIILKNDFSLISTARVVLGGTTYPTANITAVTRRVKKPGKFGPILLIIAGICLFANNFAEVGLAFLFVGILLVLRRATHFLVFSTSGNDVPVFNSKKRDVITELEAAINQAIIARG